VSAQARSCLPVTGLWACTGLGLLPRATRSHANRPSTRGDFAPDGFFPAEIGSADALGLLDPRPSLPSRASTLVGPVGQYLCPRRQLRTESCGKGTPRISRGRCAKPGRGLRVVGVQVSPLRPLFPSLSPPLLGISTTIHPAAAADSREAL
jgi:hypothetical protein